MGDSALKCTSRTACHEFVGWVTQHMGSTQIGEQA